MKKVYLRPSVKCAVIATSSILAGSSEELPGGGPTDKAPYAKSSFGFDDEEWEFNEKKGW